MHFMEERVKIKDLFLYQGMRRESVITVRKGDTLRGIVGGLTIGV
jgi:hypothetical protein